MRLFGHPVHAMLVHFPIALCSTSLFWDLVGLWSPDPTWLHLSYWSLVAGLILSVPTALTGLVDFVRLPKNEALDTLGMRHLLLIGTALVLYLGALLVRGDPLPDMQAARWMGLGLSGAATLLLLGGAWYGGELVFGHGIGQIEENQDPD